MPRWNAIAKTRWPLRAQQVLLRHLRVRLLMKSVRLHLLQVMKVAGIHLSDPAGWNGRQHLRLEPPSLGDVHPRATLAPGHRQGLPPVALALQIIDLRLQRGDLSITGIWWSKLRRSR